MGPGVNETCDEKRNLPLSVINPSLASLPLRCVFYSWFSEDGRMRAEEGGVEGRGENRKISEVDEFLISLTFTCPHQDGRGCGQSGVVSDLTRHL